MAGLKVVPIKTNVDGNLDLADLKAKAEKHKDRLAAFMVGIRQFYNYYALNYLSPDYLSIYLWRIRGRNHCSEYRFYGITKRN
jgi:hypothetical protein